MTKTVVVAVGAILVLMVVVLAVRASLGFYRAFFNPYVDTIVAENVKVEKSWSQVDFMSPVRAERAIQLIQFEFDSPVPEFDPTKGFPVIRKSGPEIRLRDDRGNVAEMRFSGGNERVIEFYPDEKLSQGRNYVGISVQGPLELNVKKVIWRCFDPQDRK
jgi:hypothetical protein